MNNRIKDIEALCMVEVDNVPCVGRDGWTMMCKVKQIDPVKFAELLIKECCGLVNDHHQWNNPNDSLLSLKIKEHFGVEE